MHWIYAEEPFCFSQIDEETGNCLCGSLTGKEGNCIVRPSNSTEWHLFLAIMLTILILNISLVIQCIGLLIKHLLQHLGLIRSSTLMTATISNNIFPQEKELTPSRNQTPLTSSHSHIASKRSCCQSLNVRTITMVLVGMVATLRIVYISIDPNHAGGNMFHHGDELFKAIPLIIWMTSCCMIMVTLLEAVQNISKHKTNRWRKSTIICSVILIIAVVCVLPLRILSIFVHSGLPFALAQLGSLVAVFICLDVFVFVIFRLARWLRRHRSSESQSLKYFIKRACILASIMCVFFGMYIICSLSTITVAPSAIEMIVLFGLMRLAEFGSLQCLLFLLTLRLNPNYQSFQQTRKSAEDIPNDKKPNSQFIESENEQTQNKLKASDNISSDHLDSKNENEQIASPSLSLRQQQQ